MTPLRPAGNSSLRHHHVLTTVTTVNTTRGDTQ
jgi:hypothetical protein